MKEDRSFLTEFPGTLNSMLNAPCLGQQLTSFLTNSFNTNVPLNWLLNQRTLVLKDGNKISLSKSYRVL